MGLAWNEVSRRYVDDEPEFYTPLEWRKRAENVKQGSGGSLEDKDHLHAAYAALVGRAIGNYQGLLDQGVCPEQARMVLPQSMYTEFIETGSLAAYARLCGLRLSADAQKEIRTYAGGLTELLVPAFPVSEVLALVLSALVEWALMAQCLTTRLAPAP